LGIRNGKTNEMKNLKPENQRIQKTLKECSQEEEDETG